MKSDPERSVVNTSSWRDRVPLHSSARWPIGGIACGAAIVEALATNPAAPAARPSEFTPIHGNVFLPWPGCLFKKSCWLPRGGSYSIDVYHTSMVTGWRIDFGCDSVWFWKIEHRRPKRGGLYKTTATNEDERPGYCAPALAIGHGN